MTTTMTTTTTTTSSTTERLLSSPSTRAQLARQAAYQLLSPQSQRHAQEETISTSATPSAKHKFSLPTPNPLPFLPILASIWLLASPPGSTLWFAALVDFFRIAVVTAVICGLDWYARGVMCGGGRSGVKWEVGDGDKGEQVGRTFVLVGFVVVLGEVMSLGGGGG